MDITTCIDFEESDLEYWLDNYKPVVTYGLGRKQLESDDYFHAFQFEHANQMTGQNLHSKFDISCELAYRDYIIVHLLRELGRLPEPNIVESTSESS